MATVACDHGQAGKVVNRLTVNDHLGGTAVGVGTITKSADGSDTITHAAINANSQIIFSAAGSAAGLLLRTKTCYIANINDTPGTAIFWVSATGAGAPAGTETFSYIIHNT
jgi:hypothetical protein